jgi:hypothetical protein
LLQNSIAYLNRNHSKTRSWQVALYRMLVDLLYITFSLRKYELCKKQLDEVEKFIELKYHPHLVMQQEHFAYSLMYHAATASGLEKGIALWKEKRDWWYGQKNQTEPANFAQSLLSVLRLYFLKEDWKNAVLIFNEMNDHKVLYHFHAKSRIYWLMLQYEIHNIEILKNQANNVSEWFKKNKLTSAVDKITFSYFKKLPSAAGKEEKLRLFKEFKAELSEHQPAMEQEMYYVLMLWIDSKIHGVPFAAIVRKNAASAL